MTLNVYIFLNKYTVSLFLVTARTAAEIYLKRWNK